MRFYIVLVAKTFSLTLLASQSYDIPKTLEPLKQEELIARKEEIRNLEEFLKKYPAYSQKESLILTLAELY
jgi:hypothetical protein